MRANISIRNKLTGEILSTTNHGVFANITFDSNGNVVVENIGIYSNTFENRKEFFDINNYILLKIDFANFEMRNPNDWTEKEKKEFCNSHYFELCEDCVLTECIKKGDCHETK